MVQLTARVRADAADRLRREVSQAGADVATAEARARRVAAKVATRVTRETWHYKRPGHMVPDRENRQSTGGRFAEALQWRASGNIPEVAFDLTTANHRAQYWIIQELGTGESAVLKRAGSPNPHGRPRTGANYVVSIPKQTGRFISPNLGWADAEGGVLTAPGAGAGQQLYLISKLTGPRGGKARRNRKRKLYIGHEITGQHMVQAGGREGFRQYNDQVLAAARRAFTRKGA